MSDIWTIVWKEWRDAILPGARLDNLRPLIFIALMGVIWPLIDRQDWLNLSSAMVLMTILFPYFYILNYIGDAFAGERERHTLETLLASRISDRAILWGKLLATVAYIWGMTVFATLLSMVVVNLALAHATWVFYSPFDQWVGVLVLALLACVLSASGGILVSLHSATTRQAQQTLLLGSLGLFVVLYLIARAIPAQVFLAMSGTELLLLAVLVLAVIDAILLAISMASFHRSRLILS